MAGEGPTTVVYLHGLGGDLTLFDRELDAHAHRWRNVAWSMPGHGGSPGLPRTTFPALARAAVELLDELAIDRATIVGHSMGGMVAQELALTHPDRVERLVLVATTAAFGRRGSRFNRQFLAERLEPLAAGATPADLAEIAVDRLLAPDAPEPVVVAARAPLSRMDAAGYRASVECLDTWDAADRLGAVVAPTLCIAGGADPAASPAVVARLADAIGGARLVVVSGAAHFVTLERPEVVDRLLVGFVGE